MSSISRSFTRSCSSTFSISMTIIVLNSRLYIRTYFLTYLFSKRIWKSKRNTRNEKSLKSLEFCFSHTFPLQIQISDKSSAFENFVGFSRDSEFTRSNLIFFSFVSFEFQYRREIKDFDTFKKLKFSCFFSFFSHSRWVHIEHFVWHILHNPNPTSKIFIWIVLKLHQQRKLWKWYFSMLMFIVIFMLQF